MSKRIEEVNRFAADHIAAAAMGALEFRQIPSYPLYFVSNRGHVISAFRKKLKLVKLSLSPDGYRRANIEKKGKQVSRLLLDAFVRPAQPLEQARHKNGIRYDNRTDNLEWGTAKDNADDRTRHGTQPIGIKNPNRKLSEDDVRAIRASAEKGPVLAARHGVTKEMIYFIRRRMNWRSVV